MTDLNELKTLWKSQDEKINKALLLNNELLKKMNFDKMETQFNKYRKGQIIALFISAPSVVIFGSFMIDHYNEWRLFFATAIIYLFAMVQTVFSIYQLVKLSETNLEESVLVKQKKLISLERLRHKVLIVTRFGYGVLWLPVPLVILSMISGQNILLEVNQLWLYINAGLSGLILLFSIILMIKSKNNSINNKLLLTIVNSIAQTDIYGKKLRMASDLLEEIKTFEKE